MLIFAFSLSVLTLVAQKRPTVSVDNGSKEKIMARLQQNAQKIQNNLDQVADGQYHELLSGKLRDPSHTNPDYIWTVYCIRRTVFIKIDVDRAQIDSVEPDAAEPNPYVSRIVNCCSPSLYFQ